MVFVLVDHGTVYNEHDGLDNQLQKYNPFCVLLRHDYKHKQGGPFSGNPHTLELGSSHTAQGPVPPSMALNNILITRRTSPPGQALA